MLNVRYILSFCTEWPTINMNRSVISNSFVHARNFDVHVYQSLLRISSLAIQGDYHTTRHAHKISAIELYRD